MNPFRRGPSQSDREDFVGYYTAHGPTVRRTAYLLCHDWHLAEDLTQTTFMRVYQAWDRVSRQEELDQYTRKILLRVFLNERRRPWSRERSVEPEVFDAKVADPAGEDHERLHSALLSVPKRQRAVIVLRYWQGLSIEEVAEAMGCATGTVKSQAAKGLDKLRAELGGAPDTPGQAVLRSRRA